MFQEIRFFIKFCSIGINFKTSEFKNNLEFTPPLKRARVYIVPTLYTGGRKLSK